MSKRFKILLSSLVALTAASPLASTMVSCGNTKQNGDLPIIPNVSSISEYNNWSDTKFHVTADTMSEMVDDLKVKYDLKLFNDGVTDEHVRSQLVAKEMKTFTEIFERQYNDLDDTSKSYTVKTTAFKKAVASMYGITLDRITNATQGDIEDFFNNIVESFKAYMDRLHMSDSLQSFVLKDAWKQFNAMRSQLNKQAMYANDALMSLDYVREHIFECFATINAEISKIASTQKIKDFLHKYSFTYIDKLENETSEYKINRMNWLDENPSFVVGQDITGFMNKIFTVYDNEAGEVVKDGFNPTKMIPGFTIKPILARKSYDEYKNEFAIGIDWACVKNGTATNDIEDATGHIYAANDDLMRTDGFADDESKTLLQILNETKHEPVIFNCYVTEDREIENLKNTYFNDKNPEGCIRFRWPKANPSDKHQAWDQFYAGIPFTDPKTGLKATTGTMNATALATAGLQMSDDNGHTWKYYFEWLNDYVEKTKNVVRNHEGFKQEDEEEPLGIKFVKNCNISANVKIVDAIEHIADTEFFASYKSSRSGKIYSIEPEPNHTSKGYLLSEALFYTASTDFSHVSRFVGRYDPDSSKSNSFVEDAREVLITTIATEAACLAEQLYMIGYFSVRAVWLGFRHLWHVVALAGLGIVITAGMATLEGIRLSNVVNQYQKPINNLNTRMKELHNTEEYKAMIADYDKDDASMFVDIKEDGSYDKNEYNEKVKEYQKSDFNDFREKAAKYSFFFLNDAYDKFVKYTEVNKTDATEFENITSAWDVGGKYFWINLGTTIGEMILGVVQTFVYAKVSELVAKKELQEKKWKETQDKMYNDAKTRRTQQQIQNDLKNDWKEFKRKKSGFGNDESMRNGIMSGHGEDVDINELEEFLGGAWQNYLNDYDKWVDHDGFWGRTGDNVIYWLEDIFFKVFA